MVKGKTMKHSQRAMRIALLFSCALLCQVSIVGMFSAQAKPQQRSPFRYVIYDKSYLNEDGNSELRLHVLMERVAFSEDNLRFLFQLILKRFPTGKHISVYVNTDIKQTKTPEEVETLPSDSDKGDYSFRESPTAFLLKNGDNELIRYNQYPTDGRWRTIILKGRDPMNSKSN